MNKDKILTESEREYKPLLFSFGISALFVVFVVLLGMCWESDDDAAISLLLSRKGNGYSPFQWRLLSVILYALYMNFPVVDWWVVNSVLAIGLGLFACFYII